MPDNNEIVERVVRDGGQFMHPIENVLYSGGQSVKLPKYLADAYAIVWEKDEPAKKTKSNE